MRKREKGFTLIELLIVVAIILIIAAIAIPNLLKSRMAANESSAVGSMRTINTSQITYASVCSQVGFASSLTVLGPALAPSCDGVTGADLIDDVLAAGNKSGYGFGTNACTGLDVIGDFQFNITTTVPNAPGVTPATNNIDYSICAGPNIFNRTGKQAFWTDESGVIRHNPGDGSAVTVTSQPI